MADAGLVLAGAERFPSHERGRTWLRENEPFRRDILDRLAADGPLGSRQIPDTSIVPWASSGWTHNRNVATSRRCSST